MDFVEGTKGINANEHAYLKKNFEMLKVGTEIEMEFEEHDNLNYRKLQEQFKMADRYSSFGFESDGVSSIKEDGSLSNGVEIVTSGRLLTDVALFHAQYKKIFNKVKERATQIISPRTGLHQHFVIQTDGTYSNLEVELNPLFLKNFFIFFKNNLAGIFWLTSAIYDKQDNEEFSYTRYDGFHKWKHLFDVDLNETSHKKGNGVLVSRSVDTSERYNALNVKSMQYNGRKVSNFHVEFRLSDGGICPAQIAIQNFMFEAIIKCALEMSLFGEIKDIYTTSSEYKNKIKKYKNNPSHENYPSYNNRYSNSTNADIDFFKGEAQKLVNTIAPFLDKRVYNALNYLASYNISEMIKDGLSIDEIETQLGSFIVQNKGNFDEKLLRNIAEKKIDMVTLNRAVISGSQLGFNIEEITNIFEYIEKHNIKIV